jgi:ETFB lysine methyltransferase
VIRFTIGGRTIALDAPSDPSLVEEPLGLPGEHRLPFWARIWPGGIALAAYILEEEVRWKGLRVVELGCGLGAAGIAAALAGAQVTMTDESPHALRRAAAGAKASGVTVETAPYVWGLPWTAARADAVVAAEVIYDRTQVAPFAAALGAVLTDEGLAALADVRRVDRSFTEETLAAAGFAMELVASQPYSVDPADGQDARQVDLFTVWRRASRPRTP